MPRSVLSTLAGCQTEKAGVGSHVMKTSKGNEERSPEMLLFDQRRTDAELRQTKSCFVTWPEGNA